MSHSKKKATIEVSHLTMKFNLNQEKHDSIKEAVISRFRRKEKRKSDDFYALSDVSFTLHPGDRVGILGLNGAGKSTLLKAIAGVYKPTEGYVKRKGKIAPLLELGAGFDKEYTARENIYLYGAVLGYTKEFIDSKFDEIVKFAELEKFVDVPVKNYSSGMKSRLGFAICTAVNPEILILDEVLSVGDAKFRKKSEARVMEMFEGNVTVLFVSHSLEQVKRICNKALILDHGVLTNFGDIDEIAEIYEGIIAGDEESQQKKVLAQKKRRKIQRKARYKDAYLIMKKKGLTMDEVLEVFEVSDKMRQYYIDGINEYARKQEEADE
ncbi:MAG: ABC transporter ATP-binding protein [Eubacterium sp.]|nr:ABC transporter ATP-binding protein [Eubacterium sp.]